MCCARADPAQDLYHTHFAVAALALLRNRRSHPALCMPADVLDRAGLRV